MIDWKTAGVSTKVALIDPSNYRVAAASLGLIPQTALDKGLGLCYGLTVQMSKRTCEAESGKTHVMMRLVQDRLKFNRILLLPQPKDAGSVLDHIYSGS